MCLGLYQTTVTWIKRESFLGNEFFSFRFWFDFPVYFRDEWENWTCSHYSLWRFELHPSVSVSAAECWWWWTRTSWPTDKEIFVLIKWHEVLFLFSGSNDNQAKCYILKLFSSVCRTCRVKAASSKQFNSSTHQIKHVYNSANITVFARMLFASSLWSRDFSCRLDGRIYATSQLTGTFLYADILIVCCYTKTLSFSLWVWGDELRSGAARGSFQSR